MAAAILASGSGQKLKNGGSPHFSGDRYSISGGGGSRGSGG